jgi:flagellar motor protein MotB
MKKVTTFLAVFLLFTCHVQSYAQQSENAKKTFIGKGLKEIDKVATKTWKDILKLFRGKKGVMLFPYKIGTNKEERRIKKHYAPKNYISVQQASSVNRNSSGDIIIKKNIQPKLNIALMYPRITPKKGYFSFKAGYFNYNTFFNDISSQDIEYIKLKVTDSVRSECEVKKFKIVLNKKRKRHVSFLLDHSGSMVYDRANELQKAVIEAIRNNSFRDKKNDFIYSIHKFDGNIKHLITSGKILDIEQALLPVTGLKGYGGSTAILDAIVQGLEIIKEDKISESKIIFLLTDGLNNTSRTKLTRPDIIGDAINNNVSIVPIGFGNGIDYDYLNAISHWSGGQFLRIYNKNEFQELYNNLLLDFEYSYEIEFSPCMFAPEIEIELKLKGFDTSLVGTTFFSTPALEGYSIDLNILFKKGSDDINTSYFDELNQLFNLLDYRKDINISIEGHTDKVGSEKQNIRLSKKRAQKVKKYLTAKGIKETRINTEGYGWSYPVYPYLDGQLENSLNRRIEIKIKK